MINSCVPKTPAKVIMVILYILKGVCKPGPAINVFLLLQNTQQQEKSFAFN